MKTDKELADELDARKRLERHGLRMVDCPHCSIRDRVEGRHCPACGGKGYTWEPLELLIPGRRRRNQTEDEADWIGWRAQ